MRFKIYLPTQDLLWADWLSRGLEHICVETVFSRPNPEHFTWESWVFYMLSLEIACEITCACFFFTVALCEPTALIFFPPVHAIGGWFVIGFAWVKSRPFLLILFMATWAFNLTCNMLAFDSEGLPVTWTCLTCGLVCHQAKKNLLN